MTLDDLQVRAFNVMALPTPKAFTVAEAADIPKSAIFKYWLAHKDVGTPMTKEIALSDHTTAVILSTGKILHWIGGDEVEVV